MEKNKIKTGMKARFHLRTRLTLRTKMIVTTVTLVSVIVGIIMFSTLNPFQSAAKAESEIKVINVEDQHFTNDMTIASPEIKTKNVVNQKTIFIKPKKIDNAQ